MILLALTIAQASAKVLPIYAEGRSFVPSVGEKFRFVAAASGDMDFSFLEREGISGVLFSTDPWSAPTSGGIVDSIAAEAALAAQHGLMVGLWIYTTFQAEEAIGLNGSKTNAWSVWNPERIRWTANQMGTINRTVLKLDAVTVGVYGEYGSAGYFTGSISQSESLGGAFRAKTGSDPPRLDWWCGDGFAKSSWQKRVIEKHGSVENALRDWGLDPSKSELVFPVGPDYGYAARSEFMDWYRGGISAAAGALSDVGSEIFKQSQILIPVGQPLDYPQQGVDLFSIAASCTPNSALQATSLCFFDFASDWVLSLGRIRGAAQAAGMKTFAELRVRTPELFDQSLFEALALGASGLCVSPSQLPERGLQYIPILRPRCEVAVLYPSTTHGVRPQQPVPPLLLRGATELRDYMDFDILDESAVMAGALDHYRAAVLFEGSLWQSKTLRVLRDWVEAGGSLIAYDFGKMSDLQGSTEVYQDLFGYASKLTPIQPNVKWKGSIPANYSVALKDRFAEGLLGGRWGPTSAAGRALENGSEIWLPMRTQGEATVTLTFADPPESVPNLSVLVDGKKEAGISVGKGASRFQIVLNRGSVANGAAVISFLGIPEGGKLELSLIEVSSDASMEPAPLVGGFESNIPFEMVKSWAKPQKKGLCVFVPVRKEQWHEYIGAIRQAVGNLSKLSEGKKDIRLIDGVKDGIYFCDFGDSFAVFNSNARQGKRTEPVPFEIGPNAMALIRPSDATAVLRIAPDGFDSIGKAEQVVVDGENALHVPADNQISGTVTIKTAGTYRVFARALHAGVPIGGTIRIGEQVTDSSQASVMKGEYLFVGEFALAAGQQKITFRANKDVKFYQLILTNDPHIEGFRVIRT